MRRYTKAGPPRRLTDGTGVEQQSAVAPDGSVMFASMKRTVELYSLPIEPDQAKLFEGYYVLQGADAWWTGDSMFLDQPFLDTGLSAYYSARGAAAIFRPNCDHRAVALAPVLRQRVSKSS